MKPVSWWRRKQARHHDVVFLYVMLTVLTVSGIGAVTWLLLKIDHMQQHMVLPND